MKKLPVLIGALFVLLTGSCSLEVPESVTVKASPGVYVPLGKISEVQDGKANIAKYISDDEIKKMVSGQESNIKLYDYENGTEVRTYLIHYPIAEMTMDLTEYMKTDIPVPEITLFNPSNIEQELPAVPVGLKDMAKLVKSVNGTASGIRIKTSDPVVKKTLQIRIPALGINDYISGQDGDEAGYLYFLGANFTLKPQEEKTITLYVKLTGACPQTAIAPEMVFEWTEAAVDTSDRPLEGSYPLNMGNLIGFLGDNIEFKAVKGYMYINSIAHGGSMTLILGGVDLLAGGPKPITSQTPPVFPITETELPQHSISSIDCIDLTQAFNNSRTEAKDLKYNIMIAEMLITPNTIEKGAKITADMVIELPLEFIVSGDPLEIPGEAEKYVKLSLGGVLPEGDSSEDLLGRDPNNKDDLFKSIRDVCITLKDIENDTLPNIALFIELSEDTQALAELKTGEIKDIKMDKVPDVFSPKFNFLLPIDENKTTGTLKIYRGSKFDLFLSIEAKTDIEIKQTF